MPWTVYDPAIQFFELDYVQICLLMYKNPKSGDREPFLHEWANNPGLNKTAQQNKGYNL